LFEDLQHIEFCTEHRVVDIDSRLLLRFVTVILLVVGVVLFLRVEVVDNGKHNHSPLPHHCLSFCTGSGNTPIAFNYFRRLLFDFAEKIMLSINVKLTR